MVMSAELACFRDIIRGINSFAAIQANWQVELIGAFEDLPKLVRDRHLQGIILGPLWDLHVVQAALEAVEGRAVGVAAQFALRGLTGLVEVESDDRAVGRLAAEHLLGKGFEHFAYLGTDDEWAVLRADGYCGVLTEGGHQVSQLLPETMLARDIRGWRTPHFGREVAQWLAELPRPLGLFAANDIRGRAIIDLCRSEEIRVPDDVAVLAVDNDDLICDLSRPQLSSIAIPWKKIGFQAAAVLEQVGLVSG